MLEVPEIASHIDKLDSVGTRIYVETGWPCYAAIPLFVKLFGSRVGVIQLVRHPVPTAMSLLTHDFYWEGSPSRYVKQGALDPFSCPVIQVEYAERWGLMSPYEKCLFWWSEINLYAEELRSLYADVPWLRVRFEDLVTNTADASDVLSSFLAIPTGSQMTAEDQARVDTRRHRIARIPEWRSIYKHERITELARTYGYEVGTVDTRHLRRRYTVPWRDQVRFTFGRYRRSLLRFISTAGPPGGGGRE